jgi:hypothetical protein
MRRRVRLLLKDTAEIREHLNATDLRRGLRSKKGKKLTSATKTLR